MYSFIGKIYSIAYVHNVGSNRIKNMTPKKVGTLLTMVTLLSCCKPTNNRQADNVATDSTQTESKATITKTVETTTNDNGDSNCIRGQAKPVFKKEVYPNTTFELNEDNRTATEIVELSRRDKLIVKHLGCEYYELRFRFETDRFQADTTDIRFWIEKGIELMDEIKSNVDSPLDISGAGIALKEYLVRIKDPEPGEFIWVKDAPITYIVSFTDIQKLTNKRFAIELSYSIGPL